MDTNQPNQNPAPATPDTQPMNTPSAAQTLPPTPKTKTPWLLISLVVLLFNATGILSFKYYKVKQQLDNQQSAPQPTQQLAVSSPSPVISPTIEVDPTANWKKLTNTKYGFFFKYPNSWTITTKANVDPQISSFLVLNSDCDFDKGDRCPQIQISIGTGSYDNQKKLEDYFIWNPNNLQPTILNQENISLDSQSAYTMTYYDPNHCYGGSDNDCGVVQERLVATKDQMLFNISYLESEINQKKIKTNQDWLYHNILDQLLKSFQFID